MPRVNPDEPHGRYGRSWFRSERSLAQPALLPRRSPLRRPGLGVPAYAHPLVAPGEWAELSRPGTPLHWVVVNVSKGPGMCLDPLFREATNRLREAGVRLLGYLDTAFAARASEDLLTEATRHLEWYAVDGFYLDRVPLDHRPLATYKRTVSALRTLTGRGHLVLGHGAHPHPAYADIADQLVTYAGSWAGYRCAQPPEWTSRHPPERFCHLVHGVPGPHLETAMRLARWHGAATVYVTDRAAPDPWEGLPSYWSDETRMMRELPSPVR